MKTLATLFVLASTILAATAATTVRAENWYKRLTPKQTADETCFFAIKAEPVKMGQALEDKDQKGEFLEFQVTMTPKGGPLHKALNCSGEV